MENLCSLYGGLCYSVEILWKLWYSTAEVTAGFHVHFQWRVTLGIALAFCTVATVP